VQAKYIPSMIILLLAANLSNIDLAHDNRGWANVARSPTFFSGVSEWNESHANKPLYWTFLNLIFSISLALHTYLYKSNTMRFAVKIYSLLYMLFSPKCFGSTGPSSGPF